jgi:hypothetical protein
VTTDDNRAFDNQRFLHDIHPLAEFVRTANEFVIMTKDRALPLKLSSEKFAMWQNHTPNSQSALAVYRRDWRSRSTGGKALDTSLQGEVKGQADPEAEPITLAGDFTRSKRHALSGAVSGRFLM